MPRPTGFVFVDDPRTFAVGEATAAFVSRHIRKKRQLFGVLHRHLGFPDHFGRNWDAINDCLQSRTTPTVLIHDGVPFGEHSQSRAIYLELLHGLLEPPRDGAPPMWTFVFPTSVRDVVAPV
jgi:RNAse (barnase) inhibitor barstar